MAGIFRYRRYRVFLAFAVISLVALWQFSGGVLRSKVAGPSPRPPVRYPHTEATSARDGSGAAPILPVGASTPSEVETVTATTIRTQVEAQPEQHEAAVQTAPPSDFADRSLSQLPIQQGEGRLEMPADPVSTIAAIHWTSMPEHFPVPSGSTIQLPEGTPKPIPRIQHAFGREDDKKKAERLVRLDTVKAAIAHAWAGYREKAWMKDEVSPVSGKSRDPFCGWGATLVDSLDTLWIVGLKKEFEEAVEAVRHIDFTTSKRGDIPVFETVIRYLGGLLAAYDVSEGKYRILLDKAVELGDVLMGAFDTPNRMPIVYYNWKPAYASQPKRAGSRTSLAELGTLSVEFTRLAQLSKEPKFYDAVARITDAMEEVQGQTRIPGLWPLYLDAAGCKKSEIPTTIGDNTGHQMMKRDGAVAPVVPVRAEPDEGNPKPESEAGRQKWQAQELLSECVPQKLATPNGYQDTFSLGGGTDSHYEYLPKTYLLLGGLVDSYRTMYEKAVPAVINKLLFRPMIPHAKDILFSGSYEAYEDASQSHLVAENTHLTCFVGGMFAMAGKIFDRPSDVELAAKLTEGCVWSYESTASGIMPESFNVVPCQSKDSCPWSQELYWKALDPYEESRNDAYQVQLRTEKERIEAEVVQQARVEAEVRAEAEADAKTHPQTPAGAPAPLAPAPQAPAPQAPAPGAPAPPASAEPAPVRAGEADLSALNAITDSEHQLQKREVDRPEPDAAAVETDRKAKSLVPPPQSHEDFVKARVQDERLPLGFLAIPGRSYILRPEAIESVFYMYRITGDDRWREAGWRMFVSIELATKAKYGNSAIDDVTRAVPLQKDEMESFWLAETLKYFYLLFSDENVISLDDWVLNTEAHPVRRPK